MIEKIVNLDSQGDASVRRAEGCVVFGAQALEIGVAADVNAKQALVPGSFSRFYGPL